MAFTLFSIRNKLRHERFERFADGVRVAGLLAFPDEGERGGHAEDGEESAFDDGFLMLRAGFIIHRAGRHDDLPVVP